MNRRIAIFSLLCSGLSFGLLSAQAEETKQTKPREYRLDLIVVADTTPSEYLIYIAEQPGVAYKSLQSQQLRDWICELPQGSTITYLPSCRRDPFGLPFTDKELNDFEAFCKSKGVRFPRYRAG